MSTLFTVIILLASIGLIVSVVMQEDKSGGLSGSISGGSSESAWSQGKGRSYEALLDKAVILFSTIVLISSVVLTAIQK